MLRFRGVWYKRRQEMQKTVSEPATQIEIED